MAQFSTPSLPPSLVSVSGPQARRQGFCASGAPQVRELGPESEYGWSACKRHGSSPAWFMRNYWAKVSIVHNKVSGKLPSPLI